MTKNHPLITVYMPTHNRLDLFPRAIKSVLEQTYFNVELIIVDDGSTDGTWEQLQEFESLYDNVRCARHDSPKGACAARNTAIKLASGHFLTGLDDDDEFLPNHLMDLYLLWDEKYAAIAASLLNDSGDKRVKQGREYGCFSLSSLLHYNRIGNQVFTLTERMRLIDGFNEALPAFQDYDCWVRLCLKFGSILKTPNHSYVFYTAHEGERISSSVHRKLQALQIFKTEHRKLLLKKHQKSLSLVKARIEGKPLSVFQVMSCLCWDNWRLATFSMLDSLRKKRENLPRYVR